MSLSGMFSGQPSLTQAQAISPFSVANNTVPQVYFGSWMWCKVKEAVSGDSFAVSRVQGQHTMRTECVGEI
jgi:hypothetical protein